MEGRGKAVIGRGKPAEHGRGGEVQRSTGGAQHDLRLATPPGGSAFKQNGVVSRDRDDMQGEVRQG